MSSVSNLVLSGRKKDEYEWSFLNILLYLNKWSENDNDENRIIIFYFYFFLNVL